MCILYVLRLMHKHLEFSVRRFVVTIGTIVTWLGPHIFYLVPKLSKSWDLARDDILSILLPDIDTWLN